MKVLTVKEVAPILQVSEWRVYDLIKKNVLPGVRMGRRVGVSESALREFIETGGCTLEQASG